MIKSIPFYYRNNPIGNRRITIPDFIQCGSFRHPAAFKKILNIGPRYYALYQCTLGHSPIKQRINELSELEIKKLKGGEK